jgi:hypothetical protein
MQLTIDTDLYNHLPMIIFGFLLAVPFAIIWNRKSMMKLKVDMMQRLPLTLEQLDAEKELIRAHHAVELKHIELKIAQAKEAEAEANAMTAEGLNRIDKLNRRLEVLQLKLAAKSKTKDLRKVDEQLIILDSARTTVDTVSN